MLGRRHGERNPLETEHGKVLTGIDLDFQTEGQRRCVLGPEAIDERHATFGLLPSGLAEPWIENLVQGVHRRAGRSGNCLHQIDVLGITGGRLQVEFVERRAAAERESFGQNGMGKHLDQHPGDDQILLDLGSLDPRRLCSPFGDVVARNHASTSALMHSRQSAARGARSRGPAGRSGATSRARRRTWAFNGAVLSTAPMRSRR